MSAFVISNRLNNPNSVIHQILLMILLQQFHLQPTVYCTKSVVLETASTSLDVRLTSNVRSTSDVSIFQNFRI